MGNRLEHRLHAGAHRFARAWLDQRRVGVKRKTAAQRNQFIDLSGCAEAVEPRRKGRIVAAVTADHQRHARQLIDAPVAEIEARTQRFRARQIGRRQRQIELAEPPRRQTNRNAERPFILGVGYVPDGASKPRDAALVRSFGSPSIGQREKFIPHGSLMVFCIIPTWA